MGICFLHLSVARCIQAKYIGRKEFEHGRRFDFKFDFFKLIWIGFGENLFTNKCSISCFGNIISGVGSVCQFQQIFPKPVMRIFMVRVLGVEFFQVEIIRYSQQHEITENFSAIRHS